MASPRKFLVLAKLEVTQYTDPVPTAAANSILVKNLKPTPLRVESEDRGLVRPYFGNSERIPIMEEGMLEFDVEIAGAGAAGTAPKYGPLLRACGFSETISAGTSVTYAPVSSAFETITLYAYRDGVLYKLTGAVGSVSMDLAAKKLPHYHFRFIGKYVAVSDAAIPSGSDFTGFQQPKASIPANTGTLTIDGYAAKVAAFSADMANQISHALWMNNETLAITDRRPTGSITVEAVTVATKDYFTLVRNSTLAAFTVTHGTVAGNKVTIAAPKVQLADIGETEFEGALAYQMGLTLNPNAGNDELTITVL
jgi:hypothetical protein